MDQFYNSALILFCRLYSKDFHCQFGDSESLHGTQLFQCKIEIYEILPRIHVKNARLDMSYVCIEWGSVKFFNKHDLLHHLSDVYMWVLEKNKVVDRALIQRMLKNPMDIFTQITVFYKSDFFFAIDKGRHEKCFGNKENVFSTSLELRLEVRLQKL